MLAIGGATLLLDAVNSDARYPFLFYCEAQRRNNKAQVEERNRITS
jgi:hypothetical protein